MTQEIITYIIIALATLITLYQATAKLRRKFFSKKGEGDSDSCHDLTGCAGCSLKCSMRDFKQVKL